MFFFFFWGPLDLESKLKNAFYEEYEHRNGRLQLYKLDTK